MFKCKGCGVSLSDNKNLCERCFRIKNYNEYRTISMNNLDFFRIIDDIGDNLTVLVIDIMDIPDNLEELVKRLNGKVILVLTKFDLIPSNYDSKFINNFIENYNVKCIDKVVISSKNNYNLDILYSKIKKYNYSNKVYFVGFTNAGKSSLINKIIYNYSDQDTQITTSNLPSTTLNTINIKIDNIEFIDTPGVLCDNSICNFVELNELKRIIPNKKIKPIVYQLKTPQTIIIDKYFSIKCNNKNDIILYFSNTLNIKRIYKDGNFDNYCMKNIEVENNNDIVIPGLGFIKVKKKDLFTVYYIKGNEPFVRKSIV